MGPTGERGTVWSSLLLLWRWPSGFCRTDGRRADRSPLRRSIRGPVRTSDGGRRRRPSGGTPRRAWCRSGAGDGYRGYSWLGSLRLFDVRGEPIEQVLPTLPPFLDPRG